MTSTTIRGEQGSERSPLTKGKKPFPWFKYLSVTPLLAFALVLVAFPIGQLIWMSFGEVRLRAGAFDWTFNGVDNFTRMFSDASFANSLRVSATFVFFTVVITLLLGLSLALVVDRLVRVQQFAQNVLIWPAVVAPVVVSVVWLLLLSPQIGLLNKILTSSGLSGQAWLGEPTGAMVSIILVDVWHWTPVVFLFMYTALRGLDSSVLEAAEVDGANYWKTLRYVVLPLLVPAIIGAAAIRIIMGVKAFDEMYLLTFGGPGEATSVLTIYLRSVFFESFQYGYGAALSVTVVLLVVAILVITFATRAAIGRISHGRS